MIYAVKNLPGLDKYIDDLATTKLYTCGSALPQNSLGAYINVNFICQDDIEAGYYKRFPHETTICCVCASEIDDDAILEQVKHLSEDYGTVKPTCGGSCGKIITLFPRRKKKSKKSGSSSARPTKKQKR